MRKIAKIGRKGPKKAKANLVVVVVTLLAIDFFANLRLHLYLYFLGMSFLSSLYGKMKILSFSTIFFLQIFKNMLYIRVIFLLRECWIMLPTLLICNSQEATNRHSYCIIWQQHKEIPLTWGIFKYDVIITLFSAEVHVHQHKGIFAGV